VSELVSANVIILVSRVSRVIFRDSLHTQHTISRVTSSEDVVWANHVRRIDRTTQKRDCDARFRSESCRSHLHSWESLRSAQRVHPEHD
jgi:hypothetical protein